MQHIHIHFINFNDHPQQKQGEEEKVSKTSPQAQIGWCGNVCANTNQFMVVFKAVIDQFWRVTQKCQSDRRPRIGYGDPKIYKNAKHIVSPLCRLLEGPIVYFVYSVNVSTEQFLYRTTSFSYTYFTKPLIMSWWRFSFNEVNDVALSLMQTP